jgi:hypothetical protein
MSNEVEHSRATYRILVITFIVGNSIQHIDFEYGRFICGIC